ncbi:hypothetical protein V1264_004988 [Littorina saxatilis]|uniref:Uncharacterized protein n=1 Tax=Littorina saxatilis TaxID=31220 RepID=A0AAN9G508_9CAEN
MGTLMSRQVATLNCWDGTVDRKRFRGTRLHSVVCKAVRLNKNTASSSNDDIKEGLKAFFPQCEEEGRVVDKKACTD